MKIACTDNKVFRLTDDESLLGELTYKNLFSYQAEITLPDSGHYAIKALGFFGTSITVTKNEMEIANLKMNWKGHIVMSFQDGREFIFKAKGFLHNQYVLENQQGEEIIQFIPSFNWAKFNYNYEITSTGKVQDILLVLLGTYAANYYIAAAAGSV